MKPPDEVVEAWAKQFIATEYLQNPESDGVIYTAEDMINAYMAGYKDGYKESY